MIKKLNPFVEKKAEVDKWRYIFVAIIIVFMILRLPLLESHFYHCDDSAKMPTYPILSILIGKIRWYISEILHYKVFLNTPSFFFENLFTRIFSLLMTLLSLWTILLIVKKIFSNNFITLLIAVIFITSQMLIIYSIHSSPYGYSMLPINIMILFILIKDKIKFLSKKGILLATSLVICPFISISSIFLLPSFSLLILQKPTYKKIKELLCKKEYIITILMFISSIIVYFYQIIPLQKSLDRSIAIHWNKGINDQFVFSKENILDFIYHPIDTFWFYFKNTMLIIENNLSFFSLNSQLSENQIAIFSGLFFTPFLMFGLKNLFQINKKISMFFIMSLITLYLMVYFNLLTLSPTRHLIWLNSFVFILIGAAIKNLTKTNKKILILLTSIIAISTATVSYKTFYLSRKNKINFSCLQSINRANNVDYFLNYQFSDNVQKYYIKEFKSFLIELNQNKLPDKFVICLISHRPITNNKSLFYQYLQQLQDFRYKYNYNGQIDFLKNISTFRFNEKLIFSEDIFSTTEFGRTQFCENGTNGRFIRVIKITRT